MLLLGPCGERLWAVRSHVIDEEMFLANYSDGLTDVVPDEQIEHWARLGHALGKATEHFNAAAASFEGRVLPAARRLEEMGATSKKSVEELPRVDLRPRLLELQLPLAGEVTDRPGELQALVDQGTAVRVSMADYTRWLNAFSPSLKAKVMKDHGKFLESKLGRPAVPTLHPSAVLRAEDEDRADALGMLEAIPWALRRPALVRAWGSSRGARRVVQPVTP